MAYIVRLGEIRRGHRRVDAERGDGLASVIYWRAGGSTSLTGREGDLAEADDQSGRCCRMEEPHCSVISVLSHLVFLV